MQEKTDVILPKNGKDEHVKCQDFQMGTEEREGHSGSTRITRDIVRALGRHGAVMSRGLSQRLIVAVTGKIVIP